MSEKGSAIDLSEYIIRVYTDDYRYRLSFDPRQTYGDLLHVLSQKTEIPPAQLQVFSQNGRRLNIRPQRMLKEVVYLRHGSILKVELPKKDKLPSPPQSNIYIRNYNQPHQSSKINTPCKHLPNMKCISCLPNEKTNDYHAGNGLMTTAGKQKEEVIVHCDHGPNAKCLKCIDKRQEKVEKKVEKVPSIVNTPRKVSPQGKTQCTHSPNLKCHQCINSIKKSKSAGMLKTQSSISSPKSSKSPIISREKSPEKPPEKSPQPQKKSKCLHGQTGKCLNCIEVDKQKEASPQKQKCNHSSNSKCLNCISTTAQTKVAHIAFDEYLKRRSDNCANTHSKQIECPNCQPPRNLRLQLNTHCDQHEAYPKGLCNRCLPDNVTLKRQEYRHVDYVQFMNNSQMHNFINYWVQEKKMTQMRIAFLYGYYAEDPYYKNGIRAIVEALYEPQQKCTANRFQLKDTPKKIENLQLIIEALGLEKIGIVIASPNEDIYFTEEQIRTIADFQQQNSVVHSTGYKISNFFTVLVRPNKKDVKLIEPEVFMISDQGQAMQAANLFDSNQANSRKMKVKTSKDEILPTVYEGGKGVTDFDIEFLLVNIASGASTSNTFAILKNNEFPTMSRGRMKKIVFRDYIKANIKKPPLVRYGDLNLLLLIADLAGIETAMGISLKVSDEEQIEPSVMQMIDKKLESLL